MRLNIRNKWISLRGGSRVTDENENEVYYVKGKFWTVTKKKFVQTMDKKTLFVVRNKFWQFFTYYAMVYDETGKKELARLRRKIFSFHDHFDVTCDLGKLVLRGNFICYDYHIILNDKEVGHVARNISLRDSFTLDLYDESLDPAFFVALVIAVDNITDQRNEEVTAAMS